MTAIVDNDDLFIEAWSEFNLLMNTDEDAADYIFQSMLHDNEIKCGCSNPQIEREPGSRCFYCKSCKREVWFTAGTLLSGVSRLRAWMAVIWFKEWGVAVSSLRISKLLDIAQSTALNINKKVAVALEAQMDDSSMSIDPRRFSDAIFKRSRHTPADQHPRVELVVANSHSSPDTIENAGASPRKDNCVTIFSLAASQQQLSVTMAIASAIAFIRKYFHGVSNKYLQLYVAAFWCHTDRETWKKGSVLKACLKHPPIGYLQLLHYHAPELKMMLI
jgi:hypothetical protein